MARIIVQVEVLQASDWSRWSSQPIRSLQYIVTFTRLRTQNISRRLKIEVKGKQVVMWPKASDTVMPSDDPNTNTTSAQCWHNFNDVGPALEQRCFAVSS